MLTRRKLLGLALIGAGASVSRGSILSFPSIPKDDTISLETAKDWAKTFTHLRNDIADEYRVGLTSMKDVQDWMKEIVPFFEYENVDEDTEIGMPGGLVYPKVSFESYQDGLKANHLLGTTSLFSYDITLTARYANPVSPWYGREDSIFTLMHELAHAQGIFYGQDLDAEASAQLVSLEVCAAMINGGQKKLVASIVEELQSMTVNTVRYLMERDGVTEQWLDFRNDLFTDPFDRAVRDKSDRFWLNDLKRRSEIFYSYNYVPMNEVYKALKTNNEIVGVKLPINWLAATYMDAVYYPAYGNATPVAEPTPLPEEPLVIDDLAYFWKHKEEYVRELH